ncbi:breast carcinoma-amplified sequence 1 [Varanus komodoensis]|uniref:breast carcinoma-amplified sequence 1 n=1 Tax=Varanus komodoensis TaxID=61221 RepID=UPI001CF7B873|nr:breast carcinoma-amplified sequence 1 [Varanus komodoensis]
MGNNISLQKEPEDQETVQGTSYVQVSSEPPGVLQNGHVEIQPVQTDPSANGDAVDARVSVVQDNVAVSSQKTMEISSVSEATGNNLGNEAKTAPPAAKSRFAFAFSRPVPGRTGEQATNSSVESATLDVSSEAPQANKASTERVGLPATAVPEDAQDKNLSQVPLTEIELTAPAKAEDATLPKPKELTLFDRLFRVEKGKDKSKAQEQSQVEEQVEQPVIVVTAEDTAGLQSTPDHVLQRKDVIDECKQSALQQDSAGVNSQASENLAQEEVKPESVKTVSGTDNSVMSFFKTLVSPSKADSKADSEDKGSQTGQGGQLSEKTAADALVKSSKKKKPDSPRLGHSTFSKLFRHKAKKDAQQTANTKSTENLDTTTVVKSETSIPPSQEIPTTKQNTKAPEPVTQQPATAAVVITNETPKEITKERSSSTPTPLSKFFWKKTPTDDIEVINTERIEASPEVPAKEETKTPEAAETKSKVDEKPTKTNLRKFFKLTLDFTDRPFTQAENKEPVGEKTQESSTEKLSMQKGNPQETSRNQREDQQNSREQETAETNSLQNGGDAAKESTPKRAEKRQSLGGFFKGLSPKRMLDAEVQTDPVSIVSVVKPK